MKDSREEAELFRSLAKAAARWIRENPERAVLIGAVGGFAAGFAGVARLSRGLLAVRSAPFLSDFVSGALSAGAFPSDSIH